jgi:hypothetical protein
MAKTNQRDFYEVLGVERTASGRRDQGVLPEGCAESGIRTGIQRTSTRPKRNFANARKRTAF